MKPAAGRSVAIDWARAFYECSDLAKVLDWESFDKKGYHIINAPEDYTPKPSLRWFAEGRDCDTPDTGNTVNQEVVELAGETIAVQAGALKRPPPWQ